MVKITAKADAMFAVLEVDQESMQPKVIGQAAAQATTVPPASREHTGSVAADDSTPARRDSIKRDLSRTIAGKCKLLS